MMQIALQGTSFRLIGAAGPIPEAVAEAVAANGAQATDDLPDLLLVSLPLLPDEAFDAAPLLAEARGLGEAMAARGSGRIVFLLSAIAGMPMRRHPGYSAQMAAVLAAMRSMAMRHGPQVLVNALGVGAVGDPVIAGDAMMPGHASVKRAGSIADMVHGVLFFADPLNTYTTGQMLAVDGGWSAGYGRNF